MLAGSYQASGVNRLVSQHHGGPIVPLRSDDGTTRRLCWRLLESVSTVGAPQGLNCRRSIRLDPKDQPVLLAAIHREADYLLTGDARHFGHLYGKRIEGVLVLRPAQYFERRRRA